MRNSILVAALVAICSVDVSVASAQATSDSIPVVTLSDARRRAAGSRQRYGGGAPH